MPNSVVILLIVAICLLVLTPLLINRRPLVARISDTGLKTRILHEGGKKVEQSTRYRHLQARQRRTSPKPGMPPSGPSRIKGHPMPEKHRDTTTVTNNAGTNDARTNNPVTVTTLVGFGSAGNITTHTEPQPSAAKPIDPNQEDELTMSNNKHDSEHDTDNNSAPSDNTDETTNTSLTDNNQLTENNQVTDNKDVTDKSRALPTLITGHTPNDPDPLTCSPGDKSESENNGHDVIQPPTLVKPGRGGFDPMIDQRIYETKYRFRQRSAVILGVVGLVGIGASIFLSGKFFWPILLGTVFPIIIYLIYLRQTVRTEQRIRDRRIQRYHAKQEAAQKIQRENWRAGLIPLEADDEDPIFDHLDIHPGLIAVSHDDNQDLRQKAVS